MLGSIATAMAQDAVLLTSGVSYSGGSRLGLVGGGFSPLYFRIVVPAGQSRLVVETSGGEGAVDIFVRRGAIPTTLLYDRVSFATGFSATQSLTINNPAAATFYISLAGYGFFGVSVRATYMRATPLPTWTWAKAADSGSLAIDLAEHGNADGAAEGGTPTEHTEYTNDRLCLD